MHSSTRTRTRSQIETSPRSAGVTGDARWATLVGRDASADGSFVYSVATTGVYCRPSCGARLPNPENVAFHDTCELAERAGFRACKRCTPNQPGPAARTAARIVEICRLLDALDETPTLEQLAAEVGLSPFHLQRLFKRALGMSPRDYAAARRAERVRTHLTSAASVSQAITQAGFGSAGRFYERADAFLGMKPSSFRARGRGEEIRFATGACTLGVVLVAATERGVCAILLGDDGQELVGDLERRFAQAHIVEAEPGFGELVARVVSLVERPGLALSLPLDIRGTAFQERVWQLLRSIPAGQTVSYTELARRLGAPKATRAVASACAQNPLAVAVPCHRVVRRDGQLAGYRWGLERKRELLAREARSRDE